MPDENDIINEESLKKASRFQTLLEKTRQTSTRVADAFKKTYGILIKGTKESTKTQEDLQGAIEDTEKAAIEALKKRKKIIDYIRK